MSFVLQVHDPFYVLHFNLQRLINNITQNSEQNEAKFLQDFIGPIFRLKRLNSLKTLIMNILSYQNNIITNNYYAMLS